MLFISDLQRKTSCSKRVSSNRPRSRAAAVLGKLILVRLYLSLGVFLESVMLQQTTTIKSISVRFGSPPPGSRARDQSLLRVQELVRKQVPQRAKLVLLFENSNVSTRMSLLQYPNIRQLMADVALRLHSFSLSSVCVALYGASGLSSYSVIPDHLARDWEQELERRFLIPWTPNEKRQERIESSTIEAEIS